MIRCNDRVEVIGFNGLFGIVVGFGQVENVPAVLVELHPGARGYLESGPWIRVIVATLDSVRKLGEKEEAE